MFYGGCKVCCRCLSSSSILAIACTMKESVFIEIFIRPLLLTLKYHRGNTSKMRILRKGIFCLPKSQNQTTTACVCHHGMSPDSTGLFNGIKPDQRMRQHLMIKTRKITCVKLRHKVIGDWKISYIKLPIQ